MKNVVKKSKFVILPALATLVLTGVASVTGTVAWFTASRNVSVSGNFITTKTDSNLTVSLNDGTGTTVYGETVSVQGKMTHGSYDAQAAAAGNLYVASLNDNKEVTAYLDKKNLKNNSNTVEQSTTYYWAAKYDASTPTNSIWYGVSWTMTFNYVATSDRETNYLLFNPSDSTIANDKTTSDGNTYKGFRIALMTDTKYLVVGGDGNLQHVTGITKSNVANYDIEKNYENLNGDSKPGKLDDNAGLSGSKYSFGSIDEKGVTITCVAWFEGEDTDSIVDKVQSKDVIMSNVTASLNFYTRSINA